MSWRARAFLSIMAARHLAVGLLCIFSAELFTSPSFETLRKVLPLPVWGALLVVTGLQAVGAAATGGELWARLVLVGSAALTAAWCAAFIASAITGDLDAPSLPITWASLTLKDLVVSAMPLRTPLEDVVRRRLDGVPT